MKNGLPRQWLDWRARFAKLSRRERGMAFAALAVGVVMGSQSLFIDPLLAKRKTLTQGVQAQEMELSTLEQVLRVLESAGTQPNAADRQALEALSLRLAEQDARIHRIEAGMITAKDMPAVLDTLLARHHRLKLVAMKTLPVEAIGEQAPTAAATAPAQPPAHSGLYRHGVELTVRGGYGDLANYVAALERLQTRLLWQGVELDATRHPDIDLTLRLYTLSLEKAWLAL